MTGKHVRTLILYVAAIGVSIFLLFFFVTGVWIGNSAKEKCRLAQQEFAGDCTEALLSVLADESKPYRVRNDAIWALGQYGDSRANAPLRAMYTGNIPDREPLNETISQYELKKAVALTEGGINIAAFIWR